MKLRASIGLVVFALALVLTQSVRVRTQQTNSSSEVDEYRGRAAVAREVLVRVRSGATTGPLHALIDAIDDQPIGSQGWHRIRSASRLVEELIAQLAGRSDVLDVEPNYVVHVDAVPNDPYFSALWGLQNTSVPGADIHAVRAWDISTGSTNNVVGVVDTGVDYTHPDLAANMWSAPTAFSVTVGSGSSSKSISCPAGSHGINAITWTCDPKDDMYHGTHVAGILGAVGNNSVGVTGVNWTTRIMALKFLDSTGSGNVADAVNAIDFAIKTKAYFAAHGGGANVRVLSNSWAGSGFSTALNNEINAAAGANMLFVAAAGNSASNNDTAPTYPASYSQANLIAVAASTSADGLASFSNWGPTSVHIAAPGDAYSTLPNGGYGGLAGTSMATPYVSGAAMLLLSACNLTTTQLRNAILNNVDVLPSLTTPTLLVSSGGRLNADKAIRSCASAPTVSLTAPAPGTSYAAPATITLAANASDPDGISRVEFYQGSTLIGTSTNAPYGGTWTNVTPGTYSLTAKAYDAFGISGVSAPVVVTVTGASAISRHGSAFLDGGAGCSWPSPSSASYTVGSGPNRLLLLAIKQDGGTPSGNATYAGAAMTLLKTGDDGFGQQFYIYALRNPASGANSIQQAWSTFPAHCHWFATDYDGVDQTADPPDGTAGYGRPGALVTAVSATGLSAGTTGDWIWAWGSGFYDSGVSFTAGVTMLQSGSSQYIGDSNASVGSGANAVTLSGSNVDLVYAIALKAAASSGGGGAPVVTLTSPAEGSSFTAPASITLTATASDTNGINRVEFYQGATLIATSTNGRADGTVPYTAPWSGVVAGSYTLTAKAYDAVSPTVVTTSAAVHMSVTGSGGTSAISRHGSAFLDGGGGCSWPSPSSASYMVGSGSNRLLLLAIKQDGGTPSGNATYAGATMTLLKTGDDGYGQQFYIYALRNPASGANSIQQTWSTFPSHCHWFAVDYAGVDQTADPPDGTAGYGRPGSIVPSVSATGLSVGTTGDWVWAWGSGFYDSGVNFTAGVTMLQSGSSQYIGDSNGPVNAGAATVTLSGTNVDLAYAVALKASQ